MTPTAGSWRQPLARMCDTLVLGLVGALSLHREATKRPLGNEQVLTSNGIRHPTGDLRSHESMQQSFPYARFSQLLHIIYRLSAPFPTPRRPWLMALCTQTPRLWGSTSFCNPKKRALDRVSAPAVPCEGQRDHTSDVSKLLWTLHFADLTHHLHR